MFGINDMKQFQRTIEIKCRGRGFNDFSREVKELTHEAQVVSGLITLFVKDTGCSLSIQERTNPERLHNMEILSAHKATEDHSLPENELGDAHEHTRMALTTVSLSIPVQAGRPVMGSWQGVCLYEHHSHAPVRQVFFHLIGY